jgi:prepilin-type processing-associated H-X9-DG protein
MNHELLDENLIGYLLEALDDRTRDKVDALLQADPATRRRLEQLRRSIEPLAADKDEAAPPDGLAVCTLARVAEFCCRDLPRAPVAASRPVPLRSWWRRADVLVAASLLLMALGLGLPALFRLRHPLTGSGMVECQNNLRVFNTALQAYHDQHRKFPSVVVERPRDAAGMIVPILASAGFPELASVRCPGSGLAAPRPMTLDQARALSPEEFFRQAGNLVPSYAYSLGHRDEDGNYQGPTLPEGLQTSDFPLMADGPPPHGGPGNSLNHAGAGQYVLFADGHVRFVTLRTVGFQKDDIYLNKANKVAAGLDPFDTVLGNGAAKP